ncbi:MAG: amidase [Rhodospirillales bacterium]
MTAPNDGPQAARFCHTTVTQIKKEGQLMLSPADYEAEDGLGLAALIAKGQVTAEEVLACAIELAETRNPAVNALSQKLYDHGRKAIAAGAPAGPFTGVPFLLKDLGAQLDGEITTQGARLFKDYRVDKDSTLVQRYKAAGFVIFGKTTSPEFGFAPSTETTLTGDTRNPWDRTRSSGGSSGGAAAAVAAGILPLAHASDGGGSIRIPASCCGLFGLKPTRARVSAGPDVGEGWGSLATSHVVSRSVRDSAAALDAVAGPAPGDPYWAPPQVGPYLMEVGADPGRLRVALQLAPPNEAEVHGDCVTAVKEAAKLLEELGHHVEEAQPPGDGQALSDAIYRLAASNLSNNLKLFAKQRGRPIEEDEVEKASWDCMRLADSLTIEDYPAAINTIHRHGRAMAAFHETYDLLLSPTLAQPAPLLGPLHMNNPDVEDFKEAISAFSPFTPPMNMSGQPSMSLPLHWTAEGLPIGTMLSAAFGREDLLFRVAGQLEQARPWWNRRPAL